MKRTKIYGLAGFTFLALMVLPWLPRQAAAMREMATLQFSTTTSNFGIYFAAADSNRTYAYVATAASPASNSRLYKVRLSDLSIQGTLTLASSETFNGGLFSSDVAVIDATDSFLYFPGDISGVPQILKVDLSTFIEAAPLALATTDFLVTASAIDNVNGFAYFGTFTTPGRINKIRLSDFTNVGVITLNTGEDYVASAVVSPATGFAYFGTFTSPGQIPKVRLSDFTQVDTLTLPTNDDFVLSIASDDSFLYCGLLDEMVRVRLSDFSRQSSVSQLGIYVTAGVDASAGFTYFGSYDSPGVVTRVRTSPFSVVDSSLTLTSGDDFIASGFIDTLRKLGYYAWHGFNGFAGLTEVFLLDTAPGPPSITSPPTSAVVKVGETASFSVTVTGSPPFTYQWQRDGVDIPGATSSSYTTPVLTLADDGAAYTCVITNSLGSVVTGTVRVTVLPVIKVYPNPWRVDRHSGSPLTFDGVAPNTTIKIFTLSMHWVKTLTGSNPITWDLKNDHGENVASGYYFYVASTTNDRQTVHGKFAVIR